MKLADSNGYVGIIFYILIVVLGLAANAYRTYTKKKEQENRQPGENIPRFPKSGFEPEFEDEEPVYNQPVFNQSEVQDERTSVIDLHPEAEENAVIIDTILLDTPGTEGQAVFPETAEQLISHGFDESEISASEAESFRIDIPKDEIGTEQEETAEAGFDLKRAVISSEILNAKYISNRY
jgi:hypothetical protein